MATNNNHEEFDRETDLYEEELMDVDEREELPETRAQGSKEKKKMPWEAGLEGIKKLTEQQGTRMNRNQPKKEASTLSHILLGAFIVLLIVPFAAFMLIDSNRKNAEIPGKTAGQVMISKNVESESKEEKSESKKDNEEEKEESSEEEKSSERVSRSRRPRPVESEPEETYTPPEEPVEEPVAPEPAAPSGGGTYVINAGDTWYGIARSYGIDVYDLLSMNGATVDTPVYPGMEIIVP